MIDNISNSNIPDILKKTSLNNNDNPKPQAGKSLDSPEVNEFLIEKAMHTKSENPSALQEAKKLLLSGQLDTPENIRAAAEEIFKFGI